MKNQNMEFSIFSAHGVRSSNTAVAEPYFETMECSQKMKMLASTSSLLSTSVLRTIREIINMEDPNLCTGNI